tara:strand:- start:529 stop:1284 length:756 start_codon:yes stop_codon:yes gene_type:complete
MSVLTQADQDFFNQNGYIVRTDLISSKDLGTFLDTFDTDRSDYSYRWHRYGYHQSANYDALVTSPGYDRVVRHPPILEAAVELMGGPLSFGEIGARHMGPYEGSLHRSWHRDRPHWSEHPYRMDYIQSMVYLTDVDESTHCFSISPEGIDQPVLEDNEAQLKRGGIVDIHGPAGTVCLFNVAVLHTATTRPTESERKTTQTYYGHRDRKFLANDSIIPPRLWKHDPDPETRAFYSNLNDVSKLYNEAFGIE